MDRATQREVFVGARAAPSGQRARQGHRRSHFQLRCMCFRQVFVFTLLVCLVVLLTERNRFFDETSNAMSYHVVEGKTIVAESRHRSGLSSTTTWSEKKQPRATHTQHTNRFIDNTQHVVSVSCWHDLFKVSSCSQCASYGTSSGWWVILPWRLGAVCMRSLARWLPGGFQARSLSQHSLDFEIRVRRVGFHHQPQDGSLLSVHA